MYVVNASSERKREGRANLFSLDRMAAPVLPHGGMEQDAFKMQGELAHLPSIPSPQVGTAD